MLKKKSLAEVLEQDGEVGGGGTRGWAGELAGLPRQGACGDAV
ncbi:MAG: hypothetical protein ACO2PN_04495 [Pyrobaculum sp.]